MIKTTTEIYRLTIAQAPEGVRLTGAERLKNSSWEAIDSPQGELWPLCIEDGLIAPEAIKTVEHLRPWYGRLLECGPSAAYQKFMLVGAIAESQLMAYMETGRLVADPIPEGVPAIRSLADLCDFFDVLAPAQLNTAIHKRTECGASISLELEDGGAVYNGDSMWTRLDRDTKIASFSISSIVEGSDATVDSAPFLIPCTKAEIASFIDDMEQEVRRLWNEANATYYHIKDGEHYVGYLRHVGDAVEVDIDPEDGDSNAIAEAFRAAVGDRDLLTDGVLSLGITVDDIAYTLQPYSE